jgi:hypothetical protein
MMHPDGARFGLARLEEAVEATIDRTVDLLQKPADEAPESNVHAQTARRPI